jgi:hypothetical protein
MPTEELTAEERFARLNMTVTKGAEKCKTGISRLEEKRTTNRSAYVDLKSNLIGIIRSNYIR